MGFEEQRAESVCNRPVKFHSLLENYILVLALAILPPTMIKTINSSVW